MLEAQKGRARRDAAVGRASGTHDADDAVQSTTSITPRYTGIIHLKHLRRTTLNAHHVYDPLMQGAPAGEQRRG